MIITLDRVVAKGVARKGEVTAELRGVTLGISEGLTVIVGTRVSGGPLVLDLISGRVRPGVGAVRVLGVPAGADVIAKDVAYVPLGAELPSGLTVMECLRMSLSLRSSAPRDLGAALDRLGVSALATRRTDTLSPGEHRVVLLAAALATDARVVLMEEPLNWFDPRALTKITEALRSIASEGRAVVVATQSALDATRIGGRTLRAIGGMIEEGMPEAPFTGVRITTEKGKELLLALTELPKDATVTATPNHLTITAKDPAALLAYVGAVVARSAIDIVALERMTANG